MHNFKVGDRVVVIGGSRGGRVAGVVNPGGDRDSVRIQFENTFDCWYFSPHRLILVPSNATPEQIQALVGILQ